MTDKSNITVENGGELDWTNVPTQAENTDRELWRRVPGDYYADSLFITRGNGIGMDVGGRVFVKPIREWHKMAADPGAWAGVELSEENDRLIEKIKGLREALEFYAGGSIDAAEDGGRRARLALTKGEQ